MIKDTIKNITHLPIMILYTIIMHIHLAKQYFPSKISLMSLIKYVKVCRSRSKNPYKLHWLKKDSIEDIVNYALFVLH